MAIIPKARPGPSIPKKRKISQVKSKGKHIKRSNEDRTIQQLETTAQQFDPSDEIEAFSDLPISDNTKRGLKKAFYLKMTDIQAKSLPPSLKGKDVLGAARTGSGKTLAFLIPVLELLYRRKWGPQDGLGALIISPTRELAMQIFDVLRKIGGYHSFSAGLVIGGKNLKDERERLARMNILVATPGRLLQHMDQTVGFECSNLQVLVLDEADRILDMGFSQSLNAIIGHLPKSRQSLLFSATLTQSVEDLARLSLKNAVSVGVKEKDSQGATPNSLEQHYLVCELDKKLEVLFSFIKAHLQVKVLVFMSSCKQVRFIYETFCKLHPGIPLLHLHGKQKQMKRMEIFQKFIKSTHSVLFATDIAARGLDFPAVDWVLQLDAPEDADTYIHRVGRTARYQSKGQSLLFLLPSEEAGMTQRLQEKNITVDKTQVKQSKTIDIQNQVQKFAFQDPEVKYLAQRAFVSYLRSVYLQKDKSVFKLDKLPIEKFAASFGLPGAPRVKFITREMAKNRKNAARAVPVPGAAADGESDSESGASSDEAEVDHKRVDPAEVHESAKAKVRTKYDRMFARKNQNVLSKHYSELVDHSGPDSDQEFITLKRADHDLEGDSTSHYIENISKRKLKMGASKRLMLKYKGVGKKLVFDEDGQGHEIYEMEDDAEFKDKDRAMKMGREFAEKERGKLKEVDVVDKEEAKGKKREKKRKRKERDKEATMNADSPSIPPRLEDGGYQSPDIELSGDDRDSSLPPSKRRRVSTMGPGQKRTMQEALEADEQLALKLLTQRR